MIIENDKFLLVVRGFIISPVLLHMLSHRLFQTFEQIECIVPFASALCYVSILCKKTVNKVRCANKQSKPLTK